MVEICVIWTDLEGFFANISEGFIVDLNDFICMLDELIDREGSVVWLSDII